MRPSTITPARLGRIRDAVARGDSNRAIAARERVDEKTIRLWCEKHGLRRRRRALKESVSIPEVEQLVDELAKDPVDANASPLDIARARLRRYTIALAKLEPALYRGELAASSYAQIARLEREAMQEVVALTPAAPKDSDSDPNVASLAATTVAKVRALVAAERQRQTGATA